MGFKVFCGDPVIDGDWYEERMIAGHMTNLSPERVVAFLTSKNNYPHTQLTHSRVLTSINRAKIKVTSWVLVSNDLY